MSGFGPIEWSLDRRFLVLQANRCRIGGQAPDGSGAMAFARSGDTQAFPIIQLLLPGPDRFLPMSRPVALSLLTLGVVLFLFPLTLPKPGLPATLKADEPAYLLAAMSLARDGDLRCTEADLQRLFDTFPYLTPDNLILASTDGWRTLFYGKPFLYSAFAVPLVAIAGANGMLAFNMLLLMAMIWMGTSYLRRYNSDGLAALFTVGFFLLSNAYAYVFWLHPEIFMMTMVTATLYFGLHVTGIDRTDSETTPTAPQQHGWRRWTGPTAAPWISGICLAFGAYHKPTLVAFALPVLAILILRRRFRTAITWCLAAALGMAFAVGGSMMLIGKPISYLVDARAGFRVATPYEAPAQPIPPPETTVEEDQQRVSDSGWWWIFRIPATPLPELREAIVSFVVGRHTGLLLYQPFAVLATLLFLIHGRRSVTRWVLLAALAMSALFYLVFIPFNWHGGGGFSGNRYFVIAYPGFLFLVTQIRPAASVLLGYAAGAMLLGQQLLMPFGAIVPAPTLQAHTRAPIFRHFPLELSLEVPGYHGMAMNGAWFYGRKDQVIEVSDKMWVRGADQTEILIIATEPMLDLVFDIRSQAPGNDVEITIEDAHVALQLDDTPQRVVLSPSRPTRIRDEYDLANRDQHRLLWVYSMKVRTRTGEMPAWRNEPPHHFYIGVVLTYRGDRQSL